MPTPEKYSNLKGIWTLDKGKLKLMTYDELTIHSLNEYCTSKFKATDSPSPTPEDYLTSKYGLPRRTSPPISPTVTESRNSHDSRVCTMEKQWAKENEKKFEELQKYWDELRFRSRMEDIKNWLPSSETYKYGLEFQDRYIYGGGYEARYYDRIELPMNAIVYSILTVKASTGYSEKQVGRGWVSIPQGSGPNDSPLTYYDSGSEGGYRYEDRSFAAFLFDQSDSNTSAQTYFNTMEMGFKDFRSVVDISLERCSSRATSYRLQSVSLTENAVPFDPRNKSKFTAMFDQKLTTFLKKYT